MAEPSTSLHEILHGFPDPSAPHRKEFLALLGKEGAVPWGLAVQDMAANLAEAIRENDRRVRRADLHDAFKAIARAADAILKELTNKSREQEIIEAFQIFAPIGLRGVDDTTGFVYLNELRQRARTVVDSIPHRPGADTSASLLGWPNPRRLCATMTREAFKRAKGKSPGDRNQKSLNACTLLWAAAKGIAETETTYEWESTIREAREGQGPVAAGERSIALSCLAHVGNVREESP